MTQFLAVKGFTTTYKERFAAAVATIVGKIPSADLIDEWLDNVEVDGAHRLQHWVGRNLPRAIDWAQCIVVLDAAHVLAADPEEGVDHEPWQDPNAPAAELSDQALDALPQALAHADTLADSLDATVGALDHLEVPDVAGLAANQVLGRSAMALRTLKAAVIAQTALTPANLESMAHAA